MNKTVLTIIVPSFNRGKYICECLNSIFNQKTKYGYKVVIADDCSTDDTLRIVEDYNVKYPGMIEVLRSEKNQKLYKNVLRAYNITKTDYFCVLDPDDFWIDELKIEKAVSFLEDNKDFTAYATNAYKQTSFDISSRTPYSSVKSPKVSTFEDFLKHKAVLGWTGTTVFRNTVFKNGIPDKMINLTDSSCEESFRGDSFRNLIALRDGKCYFSPEFSAVYRMTDDGIYAGGSDLDKNLLNIKLFINMYDYFGKKHPEILFLGHKIVKNTKNNLLKLLLQEERFCDVREKLFELKKLDEFFEENAALLNVAVNKCVKFKHRLLLQLFRKTQQKLIKKNII